MEAPQPAWIFPGILGDGVTSILFPHTVFKTVFLTQEMYSQPGTRGISLPRKGGQRSGPKGFPYSWGKRRQLAKRQTLYCKLSLGLNSSSKDVTTYLWGIYYAFLLGTEPRCWTEKSNSSLYCSEDNTCFMQKVQTRTFVASRPYLVSGLGHCYGHFLPLK